MIGGEKSRTAARDGTVTVIKPGRTFEKIAENELPDQAFALLRAGGVDTFALPREVLEDYAPALPGSRVLEDRYGVNRVGIAVSKGRAGLLAYLNEFVEEAKTSGLLQHIFDRGGLRGFKVPAQAS